MYPKVMKHTYSTLEVLFTERTKGTVVVVGLGYEIGHRSDSWNDTVFRDIDNPVITRLKAKKAELETSLENLTGKMDHLEVQHDELDDDIDNIDAVIRILGA